MASDNRNESTDTTPSELGIVRKGMIQLMGEMEAIVKGPVGQSVNLALGKLGEMSISAVSVVENAVKNKIQNISDNHQEGQCHDVADVVGSEQSSQLYEELLQLQINIQDVETVLNIPQQRKRVITAASTKPSFLSQPPAVALTPCLRHRTGAMTGQPTPTLHWGTQPTNFQEWESTKVYCHGFVSLAARRGARVESPDFTCLGNQWSLWVYPYGHSPAPIDSVGVYLASRSNRSVKIDFGFSVRDNNLKEVTTRRYHFHFDRNGKSNGYSCFAARSKMMECLIDGALVIEVYMRLKEPVNVYQPSFIPDNSSITVLRSLLMDEDSADIYFKVGGQLAKKQGRADGKDRASHVSCTSTYHTKLIIHACWTVWIGWRYDSSYPNNRCISGHLSSRSILCVW